LMQQELIGLPGQPGVGVPAGIWLSERYLIR
jgi:hypothetical protein